MNSPDYRNIVREVEKNFKLSTGGLNRYITPISTGMLVNDLILSGGIRSGWYTFFGPEQSAKSTNIQTMIGNMFAQETCPLVCMFDYEGCFAANTEVSVGGNMVPFLKLVSDADRLAAKEGKDVYVNVDTLRKKKVRAKVVYKGKQPITRITTRDRNGETNTIDVYNHPFLVFNKGLRWKSSDKLEVGDRLVLCDDIQMEDKERVLYEKDLYDPTLDFSHARKLNALKFVMYHDLMVRTIDSISNLGKEDVWDLSIQDTARHVLPHSLILNRFVTHNSTDPRYVENIYANTFKITDVFGLQNSSGEWEIEPKVHYWAETTGEKFFTSSNAILRRIPDKVCIDGTWFFVYDRTAENKKYIKGHSKELYSKHGRYFVEAPDGTPQVVFLLDSYPAMTPAAQDDDKSGKPMAEPARMFSAYVPRIKSKLRGKHCTVVGVNQLRLRPGVSYGCFPGDTFVHLKDGIKTIKEIVEEKNEGPAFSYNIYTNCMEYKPITNWFMNGETEDWLRITYNWGDSLLCTPDHKLMGWVYGDGAELVPAKEYRDGDLLLAVLSDMERKRDYNEPGKEWCIRQITKIEKVKRLQTKYDIEMVISYWPYCRTWNVNVIIMNQVKSGV